MNKSQNRVLLLALAFVLLINAPTPAGAQDLSEGQRQERCENNKRYIADYESQISVVLVDLALTAPDHIARAKTQMGFLRSLKNRKSSDQEKAIEDEAVMEIASEYGFDLRRCQLDIYRDEPDKHRFTVFYDCVDKLANKLADNLRFAESLVPRRGELRQKLAGLERQKAIHQNNLIVFRCDDAATTTSTGGKWAGTWVRNDGVETVTISGGSGGIQGAFSYEGVGYNGSGQWSNCRMTGNTANCKWSGSHNDNTKSGGRSGTLKMALNGDTLSGEYEEGENPNWSWKDGYGPHNVNSVMVKGAVFRVSYTRKY